MSDTLENASHRKERTGQVVSDKAAKTIIVRVERRIRHPRYKKVVRRFKRFHAHDEKGVARVGDWVKIQECRPISRLKCWRLVEVLGQNRETVTQTPTA